MNQNRNEQYEMLSL